MSDNVLDFLLSIRSLMTIGRFSVYKSHLREDVAQHSYFTALYAMIIADLEQSHGTKVDVQRLLRMALLHDTEEVLTGDVHHPFKHQTEAFTENLDQLALKWFENLMSSLPASIASRYVQLRKDCRSKESVEAEILKAADKIEALLWAYEEYLLGNEHVRQAKIAEDILSKLKSIKLSSVRSIVSQIRRKIETPSERS
jgi:5'-deoxynucleotidase YfbR-like HD superfamily hydrolase